MGCSRTHRLTSGQFSALEFSHRESRVTLLTTLSLFMQRMQYAA